MELKDPDTGIYNTDPYNIGGANPYALLAENRSDSYSYNVNANLTLAFKLAKELTFTVQEVMIMTTARPIHSVQN